MAETKENVKETKIAQQGDTQVVKKKTFTNSSEDTRFTVVNGVWFLLGVIETLLGFRFFLKLFGANPNSGFVDFIYSVTKPLVTPFQGIFSTPTTQGDVTTSVFETSVLVAVLVYALIAWGIVKLLTLNKES